MTKYYVIPGNPIALARVRYFKDKFYDSQKHSKLASGIYLRNQHGNDPMFTGPIDMDMIFHMPISKTAGKRKIPLRDQYHIFRPDLDNLVKYICDVAQGICYDNDCIISKIQVEKVYSDNPRTEFTLSEINDRRSHRELIV